MVETQQSGKLAVILHADVVGSTELVQRDERKAHERVQEVFHRFSDTITRYHGRVRELRGDALLAEFERASDAVTAALSFQNDQVSYLAKFDDDILPKVRIGIAMGETIIADNTLTGAGVVLAQRLEQIAQEGNIVIQSAVRETVPRRMPFQYASLGEQKLKGFDEPVSAYVVSITSGNQIPLPDAKHGIQEPKSSLNRRRWVTTLTAFLILVAVGVLSWLQPWQSGTDPALTERKPGPGAGKPSIAVLPFDNLSDDPEQEYFSDGISEDIITDLSRLANLDVISRNSSFTYKGIAIKVQEVGRDLNVQYILEGSVRKAGNRIRISAQLIDASSGHHLWAERYDRELTDIFALQDEVTHHIVNELSIQLSEDEKRGLGQVTTNSFEAYNYFLQGQRAYARLTKEGLDEAVEMYQKAISLDPSFARAYGALAVTLVRQVNLSYTDSPIVDSERALNLAEKAVSIEPESPHVLFALGFVLQTQKRMDEAVEALERAISLSPSYADGYGLLALIKNKMADSEEAIRLIEKGMILNPYYTWDYLYNLGRAYYALGDYTKAGQYLDQAIERNEAAELPRLFLIANYVRLGQQDAAEWEVTELGMLESSTTLSHLRRGTIVVDEDLQKQFFEDLSAAGLPE